MKIKGKQYLNEMYKLGKFQPHTQRNWKLVNLRIKLFSINKNKSYKGSILKSSSKIRICNIYRETFLREETAEEI